MNKEQKEQLKTWLNECTEAALTSLEAVIAYCENDRDETPAQFLETKEGKEIADYLAEKFPAGSTYKK